MLFQIFNPANQADFADVKEQNGLAVSPSSVLKIYHNYP
jgi:hypothetical protein